MSSGTLPGALPTDLVLRLVHDATPLRRQASANESTASSSNDAAWTFDGADSDPGSSPVSFIRCRDFVDSGLSNGNDFGVDLNGDASRSGSGSSSDKAIDFVAASTATLSQSKLVAENEEPVDSSTPLKRPNSATPQQDVDEDFFDETLDLTKIMGEDDDDNDDVFDDDDDTTSGIVNEEVDVLESNAEGTNGEDNLDAGLSWISRMFEDDEENNDPCPRMFSDTLELSFNKVGVSKGLLRTSDNMVDGDSPRSSAFPTKRRRRDAAQESSKQSTRNSNSKMTTPSAAFFQRVIRKMFGAGGSVLNGRKETTPPGRDKRRRSAGAADKPLGALGTRPPSVHHPVSPTRGPPLSPSKRGPGADLFAPATVRRFPDVAAGNFSHLSLSSCSLALEALDGCSQSTTTTAGAEDSFARRGRRAYFPAHRLWNRSSSARLASASTSMSNLTSASSYEFLSAPKATHIAVAHFNARHHDEVEFLSGDELLVEREDPADSWMEGTNLRTGSHGIFPSAYAVRKEYSHADSLFTHEHNQPPANKLQTIKQQFSGASLRSVVSASSLLSGASSSTKSRFKSRRFKADYFGSTVIECEKDEDVLVAAMREVALDRLASRQRPRFKTSSYMEIQEEGLRIRVKEMRRFKRVASSVSRLFNNNNNHAAEDSRGTLSRPSVRRSIRRSGSLSSSSGNHSSGEAPSDKALSTPMNRPNADVFFPFSDVRLFGCHPSIETLFAFVVRVERDDDEDDNNNNERGDWSAQDASPPLSAHAHPSPRAASLGSDTGRRYGAVGGVDPTVDEFSLDARFVAHVFLTRDDANELAESMARAWEESECGKERSFAVTEDIYME